MVNTQHQFAPGSYNRSFSADSESCPGHLYVGGGPRGRWYFGSAADWFANNDFCCAWLLDIRNVRIRVAIILCYISCVHSIRRRIMSCRVVGREGSSARNLGMECFQTTYLNPSNGRVAFQAYILYSVPEWKLRNTARRPFKITMVRYRAAAAKRLSSWMEYGRLLHRGLTFFTAYGGLSRRTGIDLTAYVVETLRKASFRALSPPLLKRRG